MELKAKGLMEDFLADTTLELVDELSSSLLMTVTICVNLPKL